MKLSIAQLLYWRSITKDRIFLVLLVVSLLSFVATLFERNPIVEQTPLPLELGMSFFVVNLLFSLISLRREPLLSYMFLTASIILNGTLFFYFKYLLVFK